MTTYGIENISYLFPYEPYIPPEEPPPDGGGPELPPVESIFTTQLPENTGLVDATYTLGTIFKTDIDGQIVGVRVYVGDIPSNAPVGALFQYTDETTGTLLASKAFGTLTPDSWNEVLFDVPVDVVADQRYVTCWTTNNYNNTSNFFTVGGPGATDIVNGHLTALRRAAGVQANGKFHVGSVLAYPDEEFNASCYFVDTIFQPPAVP